jgi:hypothetical protein
MIKPTKINMVINLAILGLLIYLTISVKQLNDKVFPDPDVMIPLMGMDSSKTELEYNIKTFLNNVLIQAIQEQENK